MPNGDGRGVISHKPVSIAGSATVSTRIDLEALTLLGISKDINVEGTALSFNGASSDTATLAPVRDEAGAVSIAVTNTTAEYIALNPSLTEGLRYIELVMGTTQTGVGDFVLHLKRKQ